MRAANFASEPAISIARSNAPAMGAINNKSYRNARTNVIETVDNQGYNLTHMETGDKIKRAREEKGWSQADLGRQVGISQVAIRKIESGETRQSKHLSRIALKLGLDPADLDPELVPGTSGPPPAQIHRDQLYAGADRLPVHASAEGGPGQIIIASEPVDFMPRPAPLAFVRDAYGLIITGDSMSPEYRHGDTALVHPHLPVVGGEVYVFYAEKEGEARATIKHLRRATDDKWHVTQHNPPDGSAADFTLSRKEWRWAHRVLGKYARS